MSLGKKIVQKSNNSKKDQFPFISICTPTFNRRPFIPYAIKCFLHQTYPIEKMEWIIIDDGTDPIGDLVSTIPQVKYFYYKERMILGKKRNLMHSKCKGDIIIYMDDDDYYPKERVSHAVETLQKNPSYLIAGSSELHIYFKHLNKIFQFGPYAPNHSTAASFAFRKELLLQTKYDETKALAEEAHFLKKYTIPLIQLDVKKTILVFSHCHNSFDKKKLLETPQESRVTDSPYKIDNFMLGDEEGKQFYLNDINSLLDIYEPGRLKHKPEIIKQIKEIEATRKKMKEEHMQKQQNQNNIFQQEMDKVKNHYEKLLDEKSRLISEIMKKLKEERDLSKDLNNKIKTMEMEKEINK